MEEAKAQTGDLSQPVPPPAHEHASPTAPTVTTAVVLLASFGEVIAFLRSLATPCALPGGIGDFDVLFVNEREVGLWLTPGRDGQQGGEHTIPTPCLESAWQALSVEAALEEAALAALAGNRAYGRWLVALLSALPGVGLREEPLGVMYGAAPNERAP